MDKIAMAVGVIAGLVLPLLSLLEKVPYRPRLAAAIVSAGAMTGAAVTSFAAIGPTVFAFLIGVGLVAGAWRSDAIADSLERQEREIPPLLKGDASIRGLFDIVWLVRYRVRMKKNPLGEEAELRDK